MSTVESQERSRLQSCLEKINAQIASFQTRLDTYQKDIRESKEYLWEARHDMDHIEKVAVRRTIEQKMKSGDVLREQQDKIFKMKGSPYFGRFDFSRSGRTLNSPEIFYIGVHDFQEESTNKILIHDWRAPVSSMFYDYELGAAWYEAPAGEVHGEIKRKRQFRIHDGQLEFMLESSVNIVDDVLQEQLSQSSSQGMKNIVSTIQREQNAIIRNAEVYTLIIQGVAGSGKTSIALHRIAFLLYFFKDSLSSHDILIISPNRVFSDYIGNVLPELGEEQIGEIDMETIADGLLDHKHRFQSYAQQATLLLEGYDKSLKDRINAKASLDFLKKIDAYVNELEAKSITPSQWQMGKCIVPDWFFAETWQKHSGMPYNRRVTEVLAAAKHQIGIHYNYNLSVEEGRSLRDAILGMTRKITLLTAYKGLFAWMNREELFQLSGKKLEYSDIFPLIYLKFKLEGVQNPYQDIKHLLIDEMQDYTPVQYAVLGRLFKCRKTILGDVMQSVTPSHRSDAEQIQQALQAAPPVKLNKSYRSTWEIMQFALGILPNKELIPMKRHGEQPQIIQCSSLDEVVTKLASEIEILSQSTHQSLGIIVKLQKQAKQLQQKLLKRGVKTTLLDSDSSKFTKGVVLCTIHLAKGLEFDRVVVADGNDENYSQPIDRNLLYVACTRAMHKLTVLAPGKPSSFLPTTENKFTKLHGELKAGIEQIDSGYGVVINSQKTLDNLVKTITNEKK
ncbi:MAG: ATP-binding domain-containing protein [Magnetococcales bacterium]|nr:ATP-binding domain-containing protein [Magnetococcales bacterium]